MKIWRKRLTDLLTELINESRGCVQNSPGYTGSVNNFKDNNSYHEKSEEDGNSDEDVGKDDHSDDNLLMVPPGLQLWYDDLLGVVDTLLTWASQ